MTIWCYQHRQPGEGQNDLVFQIIGSIRRSFTGKTAAFVEKKVFCYHSGSMGWFTLPLLSRSCLSKQIANTAAPSFLFSRFDYV